MHVFPIWFHQVCCGVVVGFFPKVVKMRQLVVRDLFSFLCLLFLLLVFAGVGVFVVWLFGWLVNWVVGFGLFLFFVLFCALITFESPSYELRG